MKDCPACNSKLPFRRFLIGMRRPFQCANCDETVVIDYNNLALGPLAFMVIWFADRRIENQLVFGAIVIAVLGYLIFDFVKTPKPYTLENYVKTYPASRLAKQVAGNTYEES